MALQIQLLDVELALISIPLSEYSLAYHGIAQIVLQSWKKGRSGHYDDGDNLRQTTEEPESDGELEDEFFALSFTPVEFTVVCPEKLLAKIFGDSIDKIQGASRGASTYTAIRVDGEGRDGSTRRILGLSTPLSAAKVPIFFMSSYFSDYLIIPSASRTTVQSVLVHEGFMFSSMENSYMAPRSRTETGTSPELNLALPPETEAKVAHSQSLSGLLAPVMDRQTKLILTGVRQNYEADVLELVMLKSLIEPPAYFSALMHSSETSFLIESTVVETWPSKALLGSRKEYLTPITLDLTSVPTDVVGIVASISGKLMAKELSMSYVSTFHSCVVLIDIEEQDEAVQALDVTRFA